MSNALVEVGQFGFIDALNRRLSGEGGKRFSTFAELAAFLGEPSLKPLLAMEIPNGATFGSNGSPAASGKRRPGRPPGTKNKKRGPGRPPGTKNKKTKPKKAKRNWSPAARKAAAERMRKRWAAKGKADKAAKAS